MLWTCPMWINADRYAFIFWLFPVFNKTYKGSFTTTIFSICWLTISELALKFIRHLFSQQLFKHFIDTCQNCYWSVIVNRLSVISLKSRNPFASFPLTRPFSIVHTWVKKNSERARKLSCSNFHDFWWNTIVPRCLSFVKVFQCAFYMGIADRLNIVLLFVSDVIGYRYYTWMILKVLRGI